ncbi:hypothetical protein G0T48_000104 [Escherichia coli]|nr:hypothetical protein [Escherichia coli]
MVVWQLKSSVTNTLSSPICNPAFSSAVIFPTTLPLLRQAFVAIRLQGGPHAKSTTDH